MLLPGGVSEIEGDPSSNDLSVFIAGETLPRASGIYSSKVDGAGVNCAVVNWPR